MSGFCYSQYANLRSHIEFSGIRSRAQLNVVYVRLYVDCLFCITNMKFVGLPESASEALLPGDADNIAGRIRSLLYTRFAACWQVYSLDRELVDIAVDRSHQCNHSGKTLFIIQCPERWNADRSRSIACENALYRC
jgi:hypothetical protein